MADKTTQTETIDLTPNWQTAVRIYCAVLENGTEEGKQMAREDLQRLARIVDDMNANAKT